MYKKYDAGRVCLYRSYTIADLCRLYSNQGLHPQTVRAWVKHGGLQAINAKGKLYIYGAIWKVYLKQRNKAKEIKLKLHQIKCLSCKVITEPLDSIIHKLDFSPSCGLQGDVACGHCGYRQHRYYKKSEHSKLKESFTVLLDETGLLYDSSTTPNKTHLMGGKKLTTSELPDNTSTPPNNANMLATQTNFLDLL